MKHRSVFVAILPLLLSIPFFSLSAFGFAGDEEKKVLYFHVGAPKTGTKVIQYACSDSREELAELGVYYPPSENIVNHTEEIWKILKGKAEETKEWILNLKEQSKDFKSILLSGEGAAECFEDPRFHEFLTFLNQHFAVKYIYCVRKIVPAIGSTLTMNIITMDILNKCGNIDAFDIDDAIKARINKRINSYNFYSRLDTTFLSYEELTKGGSFAQTFFDQAMRLKIEIPDRPIHTMGDYSRGTDFTHTQLTHLERAFSVEEGSFVAAYRGPNPTLELSNEVSAFLRERTKKILNGSFVTAYHGYNPTLELSKVLSSLIRERTEKILNTPKFHMGEFSPYPSSGFSVLEGSHRWTEGTKASITVPLAEMEPRPSSISFFNTRGLVTKDYTQDLTVKLNGEIVDHHVYTLSDNNRTIDISLPEAGPAEIEFEIPHAVSPSDLGINSDKRTLGVLFGEVQLQY
ncbi:MAG: hypothetical protein K2X02_04110 [Alphaproteobacteria bacterium]|nr:hypothetical protein [Alphaproteobacteria bacterium]